MSSAGVETPLHFDHCHSVIAQVVGEKRLLVFPPSESARLYPHSMADGNPRTSRVDLPTWLACDTSAGAAERHHWPDVAGSYYYECVLRPGDVAYIPPHHWHHVTSLSASISWQSRGRSGPVGYPFDASRRSPPFQSSVGRFHFAAKPKRGGLLKEDCMVLASDARRDQLVRADFVDQLQRRVALNNVFGAPNNRGLMSAPGF